MESREQKLVRAFVELSDMLVGDFDVSDLLYTLVEHCLELFDVEAVGLLLVDEAGDLEAIAHSAPEVRFIELLEVNRKEGPCFDAFQSGEQVISADLEEDIDRWPVVAPECLRAGYRAAHGVPLQIREQRIGAMNLFKVNPGSLPNNDHDTLRALAEIATISVLHDRELSDARKVTDQLQLALSTRVVIEQAKGMVAGGVELDLDESFRRLRRYARNHGYRLDEVARRVVSGDLSPGDL